MTTLPLPRLLVFATVSLLLVIGDATPALHAQPAERRLTVGVLGGFVSSERVANAASIGTNRLSLDRRNAWQAGLFAEWARSPHIAMRTELSYVQRGDRSRVRGFTVGVDERVADVQLEDLELPLLLRVTLLNPARRVRPYLSVGPMLGLRVGCTQRTITTGQQSSGPCSAVGLESNEEAGSVRVGYLAGAGLQFLIGARSFTLGVRYSRGSTDASTPEFGERITDRSWAAVLSLPIF